LPIKNGLKSSISGPFSNSWQPEQTVAVHAALLCDQALHQALGIEEIMAAHLLNRMPQVRVLPGAPFATSERTDHANDAINRRPA
jgi:hypothetical protein